MGTRAIAAGIILISVAAGTTVTVGVSRTAPAGVPQIRIAGRSLSGSLDNDPKQDRAPRPAVRTPKPARRVRVVELESAGWGAYQVEAKPCLNVRSAPSLGARTVSCRPSGTQLMSDGLRVRAEGVVWLHVEQNHDNHWDWAAERYLHLDGGCGA